MEEDLVKIFEYEISRDIIDQCIEEDREITKEEIEDDVQRMLRENGIDCKTKIKEQWKGSSKRPRYELIAEVYIYEKDYKKAEQLLNN